MKPKYLINDALFMLLKLFVGGAVIFGVSIHMALTSGNSTNMFLVLAVAVVVAVLGAFVLSSVRYCYLDEKGITFYYRFKKNSFVSWESITRVKKQDYGTGRGRERYFVVFNDEYSCEPVSSSDINEEGFARGFRSVFKDDLAFSEQLSHYRGDIKIEW